MADAQGVLDQLAQPVCGGGVAGATGTAFDLGRGKRMLVKGGRYNPTYMITVPRDLNGVH